MWDPKSLRNRGKFQHEMKCDSGKPRMVEGNMKSLHNRVSVGNGYDKQMEKTNI